MSNFSDKEDRALVQFALKQEVACKGRMSWELIAKQMRTKKSPEQLRCRMTKLKVRFGSRIAEFPRWYFVKVPGHKKQQRETPPQSKQQGEQQTGDPNKAAQELLALFGDDEDDDRTECAVLVLVELGRSATAATPTKLCRRPKEGISRSLALVALSAEESQVAVSNIFSSIGKHDVRQASGRPEYNTGELTLLGATMLIEACGLVSGDIFLDVGSGIGNIVAQVALATDVCAAIGVEIRKDLALRGETLMNMHQSMYPLLHKVHIYPENVCALDFDQDTMLRRTTVLFCHNTVFKANVMVELEHICCRLPNLRTVVVQDPFCHRHRPSCIREFCALFRERESPLHVTVTFKQTPCKLAIFDRVTC